MINVNFFATLRVHLGTKQMRVSFDEISVFELLLLCEKKTSKPFLHKLCDREGRIIPGTIILVNGQNILHLDGIQTIVRNGADVALFPPGGGG